MNEEIKHLINQLDVEDSRKQVLLKELEQNGVTEELGREIQALLKENEDAIRAEAPELMAELEQAHRQAAQQIEMAQKEFIAEMDQVDQEAGQLAAQASQDVDTALMEESREVLS